jgi:hypothetical protein
MPVKLQRKTSFNCGDPARDFQEISCFSAAVVFNVLAFPRFHYSLNDFSILEDFHFESDNPADRRLS